MSTSVSAVSAPMVARIPVAEHAAPVTAAERQTPNLSGSCRVGQLFMAEGAELKCQTW
jgi:hypothetical protein